MPDLNTPGSLSPAAALGSAGAGLLDTYFPALKAERDKGEADKKYDKELQMKALHDLIASGSTQVGNIPRLMQMHADLAGIGKLPGVQEIIDHMQKAATAQVPYGPESTRTVDKPQLEMASPVAAPQGLQVPQTQLMSVPEEPATPRVGMASVMAQPKAPASDLLGVNRSAVLRTVPTEETYQPTRTAGDLTQDDLEQNRKSQFDLQHQMAMLKRESELADQRGDQQAKRDAAREMGRLKDIQTRGEESRKTQNQLFDNKLKMLEPEMQAHAGLRKAQIAIAIAAQNPGMDPTEIDKRAGDMAFAEVQIGVAQKKAQIEKSKAEITHWRNVDAMKLVSKGGDAVSGMSAGQARLFRLNTLELMPELNSTRTQLEKLKSDQALMGGSDPAIQQRITELSDQQDKLLLRLKEQRDKVLGSMQSGPSSGPSSAPRQSSRPAGAADPLGLFQK